MAPLVALTSVHGSFAAHVIAARLASEGIDVELRGALGGAYGFTVGDLARVDLYVPADQVADARLVLLAGEVDAAMEVAAAPQPAVRALPWAWVVAFVLVAAAIMAPVLRSLSA